MAPVSPPFIEASKQGAAKALTRSLTCMALFARRHAEDPRVQAATRPWLQSPWAGFRRARLRHVMSSVAEHSHAAGRPLRILELACGAGLSTCALATQGHRALGIEANAELIRVGRLFAQESKLDGMFLHGNPLDSTWQKAAQETLGGVPDIIYLGNALHGIPDVASLLERLRKWLEPGGRLLISEENPLSPIFRMTRRTKAVGHRSFSDWKQLLESHGFSVDQKPQAIDPLPGMARVKPDKCWSIVFTAQRG